MMIIEAKDLTKDYVVKLKGKGLKGMTKSLFKSEKKIVHAVKNVDLSIEEGELVGYIGPNGAGKSTTIKMLTGILQPTSGQIRVCGLEPSKNRVQNAMNVGAVFGQKTQLWWDLPVRETFELLKRMYSIPDPVYQKNLDDFMDFLELESFINQPVRQLSLGQRMRAEIAASLLHSPKVLYLDEPTIGLDINIKLKMREFIKKINQERGVTVMLTTHDLQDIEQMARRIVVINHGTVCFNGTMEELSEKYAGGSHSISFTLQTDVAALDLSPGLKDKVKVDKDGRHVKITHPQTVAAADILTEIFKSYSVSDIEIKGPQIEDVVMEVYNS
ncbi:MAG TPA: sugar ABC transporter ATP-binding protein [Lachnospiraceae bacterium]|nr:sugar ABC transporter ATP-binding protein [Lachnospiraceae bacterium]